MHRASALIQVVKEDDGHLSISKKVGTVSLKPAVRERPAKQLPTYTIEEVHANNTPEKAWVAIRGHVYDMTKFADKHPGGRDMLLIAMGRDATAMYESMHTDKNTRVLKKYMIGKLKSTDVPTYAEKSDFAKDVEERVLQHFKDKGIDPREAPGMLIIYSFLAIVFAISYYGMFSARAAAVNGLIPWISAAISGWTAAMMGFYLNHDGCHGAWSRNPNNWARLRRIYECFTGLSTIVWIYQHGMGHHPFTNVVGVDPDIVSEDPGVLRVHTEQPWWDYYGFQKYYWFPLYTQLVLSRKLTEWKNVFYDQQFKHIVINPTSNSEKVWAVITMSIYSLQHFIIPYFYFNISILRLIAIHTVTDITWSVYLTMIFQASHVNDEVAWPQPNEDGYIDADWAKLQVESSLDFAHGDFWTTFLCGSLNYQAVHHLFPYICQWHYPAIAPIVKEECVKHGVKYNLKDSVWQMMAAHVYRINLFGENPALR